jgi:hypothetical protein
LAAEGRRDKEVAVILKMIPKKVSRWRKRFLSLGMAGLERDTSAGTNANHHCPFDSACGQPDAATAAAGYALEYAQHGPHGWHQRSQRAPYLARPRIETATASHRLESFKISNDPEFAEKLQDVVGLYLSPPTHALVLCVDEKSQIQALDRTQPGLPLAIAAKP